MDKSKFKKLALMGITGGVLSIAQAPASADASIGTVLAAKCGAGSCGGLNRPQGSCGGQSGRPQGSCGGSYRPQGSCGGTQRPHGSCGGQNPSRGYNFTADAGSMPQMQDQQYQQNQQKKMSENDLLMVLSPETRAVYMSMDADGRALALKLANQDCKGMNDCKGLNSCKSTTNSCAGLGSCKGTSVGPFKDKNAAVKVAAKKMAEKRTSMNRRNPGSDYNSY